MHEVLDKQPVLWLAHTQSSGNEMSDHDSVSASDNDSEYVPDTDSLSYSSSDTMGESVSDSCEESDNFQAEDGIRDFCLSRGLGDVYKRQETADFAAVSAHSLPRILT